MFSYYFRIKIVVKSIHCIVYEELFPRASAPKLRQVIESAQKPNRNASQSAN